MTDVSQDEILLGAVASALVAVHELRNLTMFQMPYPPSVQRALDRFVLHCLRRGARPPTSLPGLVRWAYERPLGVWPLRLPDDVYLADERLVDEETGIPTAFCHEIALVAERENPLREASRAMATMASLAAERNRPSELRTMRDVLATHPMLTNEGLNSVRFASRLGALDEYLGVFYRDIGAEYQVDGKVYPCAHCGTPLQLTAERSWWCEREECGLVSPGDALDWDARVKVQGDRRHRQFVSGPGRAVLRIVDALASPGIVVCRWPVPGFGDLRVEVPDGQPWTASVVDWHSPALLGRAIARAVDRHGVDAVTWVVAQYRVDADADYLRVVRQHAEGATGTPWVCSAKEFIEMVRSRGGKSAHA